NTYMDMDILQHAIQWPAMIVTLVAAWLVAAQSKRKRNWGFWCFILSNLLWIIWGWHDNAYALIALQVGLFALNLRGASKNNSQSAT
ncbi:MAG: hypothetical protein ABIR84_07480, partial [Candidatus Nitrotoga sp.]